MPRRDVLVAAGVVVGVLELAAGTAGIVLLGPAKIALVALTSGVATAALSIALRPLLEPAAPPDGQGGASDRADDDPPPWWPGFEADFRAYARDGGRERTRA